MKEVGIILLALLLIFGIGAVAASTEKYQYENMDEWISPDGVHYWRQTVGYKGFMAPRYDHDGRLVIEDRNEK